MFGTRDEFIYEQCADCDSLQIAKIPGRETLARYYPPDYYSFNTSSEIGKPDPKANRKKRFLDYLMRSRDLSALGIGGPLGYVIQRLRPAPNFLRNLAAVEIQLSHRILDVGCGTKAELLDQLVHIGFVNVLGIDPFIAADTATPHGAKIQKKDIHQVTGEFDLVMFHHSFEHLPDPRETLLEVRKLLQIGGHCLIRIPTPSSEAYEIYGANWVQLDSPRHLVLASRDGMKTLATDCGFSLERVLDDSWNFQFTGSELYLRDIPLLDQHAAEAFNAQAIQAYDKRSEALNATHRGDQAAFVLAAV